MANKNVGYPFLGLRCVNSIETGLRRFGGLNQCSVNFIYLSRPSATFPEWLTLCLIQSTEIKEVYPRFF
jgi:hypothetical protein